MLRSLLTTIVLTATALSTSAQLKVGDALPAVEVVGLSQTEATSFGDFYGRTVLLEFFAHWCQPCALSVPHLNELQEKFGARGFSVVAVTSSTPKQAEPWIQKHGGKYAFGYDKNGELQRAFNVTGIPFGALIDPYGMIVWTGHPGRLADEVVEAALAGALERPVWQWPAELKPLAGLLRAGDFAGALTQAETLPPQAGLDLPALVRGRYQPLIARLASLIEQKDYGPAFDLGARLEKGLTNLPEAGVVAERLKTLRADPEALAELRMLELERRAVAVRKIEEAEALRGDVAAFVEQQNGQRHENRAKALLQNIDRALERAHKQQEKQEKPENEQQ